MKTQRSIGDLVAGVLKGMVGRSRPSEEQILAAWEAAVGCAGALHARPVALKRSVLMVNVDSSPWLYELSTKKREILEILGRQLGGKKLKDIRLRIGNVNTRGENGKS